MRTVTEILADARLVLLEYEGRETWRGHPLTRALRAVVDAAPDMREAFEWWLVSRHINVPQRSAWSDCYPEPVQAMWEGWQARAAHEEPPK